MFVVMSMRIGREEEGKRKRDRERERERKDRKRERERGAGKNSLSKTQFKTSSNLEREETREYLRKKRG